MAFLLRVWAPKARIDALTSPKNPIIIAKVDSKVMPLENDMIMSYPNPNAYKTARMMPMTKAALMFEAQQQGIFGNLCNADVAIKPIKVA